MPTATINGATINYEVHGGDGGDWVALMPGGRRALDRVESLGKRIAAAGYRVLIHDRRNCGASEVTIGSQRTEHEMWSDDLHALLEKLGTASAFVGGSSSGCRMAVDFALRYPQMARGLLLWRPTGGRFAVERLTEQYYGDYMRIAKEEGMAAVCESEHFREIIEARPANREKLMGMNVDRFIAEMLEWDRQFRVGADQPIIGATQGQLESFAVPACIVPGNDKTHPREVGETLARLIPGAELHELMGDNVDVDMVPHEDWDAKESQLAGIFIGCLERMRRRS